MTDEELFPEPLRRVLERRSTVAFVGAGFTRPLGFPTWDGLLGNLLAFCQPRLISKEERRIWTQCKNLHNKKRLVEAADELKRLITPADYNTFLNEQFNITRRESALPPDERDRMARRLLHLTSCPWAGIVTTNFDDYIRAPGFDWRAHGSDPSLGFILSKREQFYVKLHNGSSGGDIVFTNNDYADTYLNSGTKSPTVQVFLRALMLSHPIVFIGASLEHRLLDLRRELSKIFNNVLPEAWALVPNTQDNRERIQTLKRDFQIQLITYPTNEKGKPPHHAVDHFLELAARCQSCRTADISGLTDTLLQLDPSLRLKILDALDGNTRRQVEQRLLPVT